MIMRLKQLRNEREISQQTLADIIGVSQQSVNKYENHSVEPDIKTLIAIARFFGVSADYLIGASQIREPAREITVAELTATEEQLVLSYRKLSKKQRECIFTIVNELKSAGKR